MIRGRVDVYRQAWVQLEVQRSDGDFETIEAVADTGFDGHLALPKEVIGRLRVELHRVAEVELATGTKEEANIWRGNVRWHGQIRRVYVLEANGVPLLGMELMEDSQLTLQPRINGWVLIERLDEIGTENSPPS